MKRYLQHSASTRVVAVILLAIQVLLVAPTTELGAAVIAERQKPTPIRANRTVPKVTPVSAFPVFSENPSNEEITRARVFEEPLIPMTGISSVRENADLASALTAYLKSGNTEDLSPLESCKDKYPDSIWRASLMTDMGIVYRRTGYFSKALETWHRAWELSKSESEPRARAIADRALAEWAELNARLGRYEILEPLFEEVKYRPIGGSASEKLNGARNGLWLMQNRPQDAFRCGPMALDRILAFLGGDDYKRDDRILKSESTKRGMSLPQVVELGNQLGMKLQMAKRSRDAEVLLPAVVHWKAGHYAALLKEEGGRYLVQDPTFGDELWVSRKALEEETSGYFLVPEGALPSGWERVQRLEGGEVWGKGTTNQDNTQRQTKRDQKAKECGGEPGMAYYDIHLMLVNLNIVDLPVGYAPPRGPSVDFRLTYNHRDAFQPALFSYSNLGPKWTIDWLSYITDNPSNSSAAVTLYVQGGGEETYSGYNAGTQSYAPHYDSRAVVVRTSSSPIEYELRMPDGSVRVFTQPDGASSFPRKVFMTEWIDPAGNGLTFTYDSSLRLVAVTDAIGQVTTLSYELSGDPLKITRVTDPFGRYATFLYNVNGRLETITDVIGLQSSFEYNAADFIRTMTTPYGTTTFEYGQVGRNRWIEATDPLGNAERVEFKDSAPGISASVSSSLVPSGMQTMNANLTARNTFYWDKRALALDRGDYTKARITHWLHDVDINVTSGVIESTKAPLENRVWYQYPNQSAGYFMGSAAQPIKIGRVLDDGTTQLLQFEYNVAGKVVKSTDPLGRETVYVYGSNNIPDSTPSTGTGLDLLQIKQKNGGIHDVLASFTYNNNHQPLTSTDAALQVTTTTYNANGDLATIVTAARSGLTEAQRTTAYSYYADTASLGPGRLERITGPVSGATMDFAYDDHGRLATVTGPDGYAVTTEYDNLDRPTRTTYPDSTYEEMIYAKLDLARTKDRQNRWTHFFYDANRQLVSTRDSLGRIIRQEWCACGALSKLVDASGNVTRWEHDAQNRVTSEKRADNSETQFAYENTTSRLKRRTDSLGQHTDYTYFRDNTLQQVSYPNAIETTPAVSFTYGTAYSRVATMSDGVGTTTYSYYAVTTGGTLGAAALASIDGPLANDTIAYTYDELGRSSSQSINGVSASQTYDPLGRVNGVTNTLGTFTYGYVDQTNRLAGVTYPNGQTSSYSYYGNSADRRLQQIQHQASGAATISKFDYAYDTVGNITNWSQQRDSGGSAVTRAYDFGYDSIDQLASATYRTTDATPTILKSYAYTYDTAGNRTTEQIDNDARQANYNTMNRLTSQGPGGSLFFAGILNEAAMVTIAGKPATVAADHTFSGKTAVPAGTSSLDIVAKDYSGNQRTSTYSVTQSVSTRSFTYDANGNTIDDGTRTFEWDAENRLLAVEGGTHRSEFTYDGQSRRVRIIEKENGSTTSDVFYLWCGLEICEERDSTGAATTKRFFPQGEEQGASAFFYNRDHLGSLRELTDSSGNIVARYDYDPFGRRSKLSGSIDSAIGYTGQYQHSSSGLMLTLYRAYDPDTGRWLSEDPISIEGGINLYAYVEGQPINLIDPFGLSLLSAAANFGTGFLIGAAATVAAGVVLAWSPVIGAVVVGALVVYGTYQTAVILTEIVHGVSMETGNPLSMEARVDRGARLAGEVVGAGVAGIGKEYAFSKDTRIAPFGNRTGNKWGELPHYHAGHRSKPNSPWAAGQSYKRHRPWEPKPQDKTWCDRLWPPKRWPRK